jgi:hypothetical protein
MSQGPSIDTRVAGLLNRLLPGFEKDLIAKSPTSQKSAELLLKLPPAPDADYQFLLWLEPEMQIHARLLGTGQNYSFWYMPFEAAGYREDLGNLGKAFAETVETVILHPTRIVQKRGLLSHSFKLECEREGAWHRIYQMSYMRFAFEAPRIRGRRHVYCSPPIVDV